MASPGPRSMKLLIDENVPESVAQFFEARGHEVIRVRDVLPAQTPDPAIAIVGDQLSAIVVTWDRGFDQLVQRVPRGNRTKFRNLGRITFRCKETQGRAQLEKWIAMIELHYELSLSNPDSRIIVEIQGAGVKFG